MFNNTHINVFLLFLLIGLFVGILTALAQFLFTHEKYSHHFKDKKQPLKIAIETGLYTLGLFIVLMLIMGFLLVKLI